jgi:predicted nucleic acid-binding protein
VITGVDTSILIDILEPDPEHGPSSREALQKCMSEGALHACEVVWAEVATAYGDKIDRLAEALDKLGIVFSHMSREAALQAARCWHAYRKKTRKRDRIAADFLIGGHALTQCSRLLTRDKGFYRQYFKPLELVVPGELSRGQKRKS